jgi:hypothetical protein
LVVILAGIASFPPASTCQDQKLPSQVAEPRVDSEFHGINVGDMLKVMVLREPDLSGPVCVRPDGSITLPLVGEIRVVGLTVTEVQELIAERLKPFLPDVTVMVNKGACLQTVEPGMLTPSPLIVIHSNEYHPPPNWPKRRLPPLWPFAVAENGLPPQVH